LFLNRSGRGPSVKSEIGEIYKCEISMARARGPGIGHENLIFIDLPGFGFDRWSALIPNRKRRAKADRSGVWMVVAVVGKG